VIGVGGAIAQWVLGLRAPRGPWSASAVRSRSATPRSYLGRRSSIGGGRDTLGGAATVLPRRWRGVREPAATPRSPARRY